MANKTALHQATGHHSKFLAAIVAASLLSFHSFGQDTTSEDTKK
jgi:hypothetical protein